MPPRGTPIRFINGVFHDERCWSESWLACFEKAGFEPKPWNLPGRGTTPPSPRGLRWTSLGYCANALVDEMTRTGPCPILVGHSLGAMLIEMRLRKLKPPAAILLAPTRPKAFRRTTLYFARNHRKLFQESVCKMNTKLVVSTKELCRRWFFCTTTPDEIVNECYGNMVEESYLVCQELIWRPRVVCRGHTGTPVLVIRAREDQSVPAKVVEQVAALHDTIAEPFDDMGHDMMLEPGWQKVAERMIDWLQRPETKVLSIQ